jgi:iron-sulfur cluster insertion protein
MDAPVNDTPASESPLVFTDAAALKVADLIRAEGNPALMLRVFVQGGGCSGLQYGFEFDEQLQDGDTCVENQGVKLLIDPMSVQYLGGAEIDFATASMARSS